MIGSLDSKQIEEVLALQVVGRIGCSAEGITYVVPISYAYDGEYIYGYSLDGMKVEMMRKNPAVCFEVEDMKDMANWKSVISWGTFEELPDITERNKGLQILADRILPLISSQTTHLSPLWPFPADDPESIKGIVFRIRLKEKTGRFETNIVTSQQAF